MAHKSLKISSICLLIMACILQAHARSSDTTVGPLMCYACDDCAVVDKATPTVECTAQYFEPTTVSTPSTAIPTTLSSSTETTTLTITTQSTTTSTSTESNTVDTTNAATTEPPVPTPPTIGPPPSTTTVPTPPTVGNIATGIEEIFNATFIPLNGENATVLTHLAEVSLTTTTESTRQRRDVENEIYSYHCYSIQTNVNGSKVTTRGCSRVTTMQGVCEQLKDTMSVPITKCSTCPGSLCNGSNALAVSSATLLIALFALLLNRN